MLSSVPTDSAANRKIYTSEDDCKNIKELQNIKWFYLFKYL